jgi:hypothetical protein
VPKIKKGLPQKAFFPYGGFKVVERFEKVRDFDPAYDKQVIDPRKGFTEEDLKNAVYGDRWKTDFCKGIKIFPHIGAESIDFIGCRIKGDESKWRISDFTKTQYGGIPAHLIVCKILEDTKKKFLPKMKVNDEAEYCGDDGKHDKETLKRNFEESAILIDRVGGLLKQAFEGKGDVVESGGEMALRARKQLEEEVV